MSLLRTQLLILAALTACLGTAHAQQSQQRSLQPFQAVSACLPYKWGCRTAKKGMLRRCRCGFEPPLEALSALPVQRRATACTCTPAAPLLCSILIQPSSDGSYSVAVSADPAVANALHADVSGGMLTLSSGSFSTNSPIEVHAQMASPFPAAMRRASLQA